MTGLEFRMLGPLEVARHGNLVAMPPGRPRALLGRLLISAPEVVPAERLRDDLWHGEPPPSAAHGLQVYVSTLRKLLEPEAAAAGGPQILVTRPPGYLLAVPPEACDAGRFEGLAAEGNRRFEEGRFGDADDAFRAALALWRGPVLCDLDGMSFVEAPAARRADEDANPKTEADPGWVPLLSVNHPEYPSGHGFVSSALVTAVAASFGTDRIEWTLETSKEAVPQLVRAERTYAELGAIPAELDDARVWGGLHYRASMAAGRALGVQVARHVLSEHFRASG